MLQHHSNYHGSIALEIARNNKKGKIVEQITINETHVYMYDCVKQNCKNDT